MRRKARRERREKEKEKKPIIPWYKLYSRSALTHACFGMSLARNPKGTATGSVLFYSFSQVMRFSKQIAQWCVPCSQLVMAPTDFQGRRACRMESGRAPKAKAILLYQVKKHLARVQRKASQIPGFLQLGEWFQTLLISIYTFPLAMAKNTCGRGQFSACGVTHSLSKYRERMSPGG